MNVSKPTPLQAEDRRNDDRQRELFSRTIFFAVEGLEARVEFAGTPALERCFVGYCGRQRDDCAYIQCPIGPTIETLADPGGDRVIDRRMT